ncbi:MAG: hypothetical protein HQL16_02345 [Candidatus Omnitrophica bacterium]|nr:hypothetical protein [Candidatus Omnitrophota bacterium]
MNSRNEQASALLLTLLVLVVIGILGMTISLRSVQEGLLAQRYAYSEKAFWLAEAGVQKVYWELVQNNCLGLKDQKTRVLCHGCDRCGQGDKILTGTLDGGTYQVILNNDNTKLNSIGTYTPNRESAPFVRTIQVKLAVPVLFGYANFSRGRMSFSNNANGNAVNNGQAQPNNLLNSSGISPHPTPVIIDWQENN